MEKINLKKIVVPIVIVVMVILVLLLANPHYYILKTVNPNEVGVMLSGGQIKDVVGPGVYSDFGFNVKLVKIDSSAHEFSVHDEEVVTNDSNRLEIIVSGSVMRPDATDIELVKQLFPRYKNVYTDEEEMLFVVKNKAQQAMKSCVGDRDFRTAVIGSARDDLVECISKNINIGVAPYGLRVENVVVPDVKLSDEVKEMLDAITASRLAAEKAEEDRKKVEAQGLANVAEKEAEIRVQQAERLEKARQEIELAELDRDRLIAEQEVIRAQKENELIEAQKEFEIAEAKALAAAEQAKADLAQEIALAQLYQENPLYYEMQVALANASAIKDTDKLIFTVEGSFPQLIFGEGILPTVPAVQQ